jgi:3-phosphoshikimate 1-carboxyvinyltransferase
VKVRITPSAVTGEVSAPPSKSYTHRAVILASLAAGETIIEEPLLSDDTLYTIDACRTLGADIELKGNRLKITGTGGQIRVAPDRQRIFAGNSGSTIRMVAPLAALAPTRVVFDGDSRLRQRPIGDLLSALESLGVGARSLNNNGCPPIEIQGGKFTTGEVTIPGQVSSQHISGLLMIAPYTTEGLRIKIAGGLRSRPYIDITLDVMQAFGVEAVNRDSYKEFLVKGGQEYKARRYRIEGDYSSAAYFLAAGAIGGKPVTVSNLKTDSVQGDRYLLNVLSQMGCSVEYQQEQVRISRRDELSGVTVDMGDYPDIVPTVAIAAAYAQGKTEITNIGHLRFKESDRLSDTAAELAKMGIKADVTESAMVVYGGKPGSAEIEAHGDHRMAMSFAVAALFAEGDSIINGAEAVTKSYPQFFADLAKLRAKVEELP